MTTRLRLFCALVALLAALAVSTVAASDTSDQLLPVPQRSQLDGTIWAGSNCGPSSLAMILEAFGDRTTNVALRTRANQLLGVSSPSTGTRIEDLARVAEEHGLEVNGPDVVVLKKDQRIYRRWTLDEARAEIRDGHPVMVQVWLPALPNQKRNPVPTDHYIVLTGTVGNDFIYNDPADSHSPGYQLKMTEAQLTAAWRSSGAPFAAFSAAPGRTGKSLLPPPPPRTMAEPAPVSPPEPEGVQLRAIARVAQLEDRDDQEGLLSSVGALPGYSPAPEPVAAPEEKAAEDTGADASRFPALPLSAALVGVMVLGAILYSPRSRPARKRARKLV